MQEKIKLKSYLAKETFVYKKNRKSVTKSTLAVIVSIFLATVVAILIGTALGYNPGKLISGLFTKAFIDYNTLIFNIAVLGIGGIAFAFAFKVGTFNIGISGQLLTSGVVVLVISKAFQDSGLSIAQGGGQILMFIIAFGVAALVGTITSLLEVFLKVNVVVSSILINWIVYFFVKWLLTDYKGGTIYGSGNPISSSIDIMPQFQLSDPVLGGWLPALIILIILAVSTWALMKYTVFGKKTIAVGHSFDAATYAGYNTKALKISTMAISSGIAGILGYVLYTSGKAPSIPVNTIFDAVPIQGFNGIAIGLIALNNPLAILPVAFIMGMFQTATPFLDTPGTFSGLIMGLIMLGATLFVVILWFKPWVYLQTLLHGASGPVNYKRYENKLDSLVSNLKADLYEIDLLEKNNQIELEEAEERRKAIFAQYKVDKAYASETYKKDKILSKALSKIDPSITKLAILEQEKTSIKSYKIKKTRFLDYKSNSIEDKIHRYKFKLQCLKSKMEKSSDSNYEKFQTAQEKLVANIELLEKQYEETNVELNNLIHQLSKYEKEQLMKVENNIDRKREAKYNTSEINKIKEQAISDINKLELSLEDVQASIKMINDSNKGAI